MCDCGGRGRDDDVLADSVMQYLDVHPQAMDTLAGIAEWWLLRQTVRAEVGRVAEVLESLTEQGWLERIGDGESARYRRARAEHEMS